ncbi:MAG: sigma 54-interacting transcriptional regulator [Thermodesulfobacteriota bacterium]
MIGRIAVIAPYADLKGEAEAAVEELGIDVLVDEGDLAEGIRAAKRAVNGGAEVIVSRGGTALLIGRTLNVPVVEIEVSPYDILRCLYRLREYQGVIGITGFRNVVYGCESLGNILGMKIRQIVVESMEDAREKIREAARSGVGMILGDAVSVKTASKLGIGGMLVVSGKEAVAKAIEEARKIAEVRVRERERSEVLRVVVENSHDGILAIDREERITLFNPAAERIFGVKAPDAIGASVRSILPNTELPRVLKEGRSEYGALQRVRDKTIVTQRLAVKVKESPVAAIANFTDVTDLQRLEQIVRQKMHTKGFVAKTTLDDLVGRSPSMSHLKERVRKFAAVDASVLIGGESGTGKEMLAQSIHNLSRRAKGPFVAVNCAALPESLLESELFGYEEGAFTGAKKGGKQGLFELAHGGTIFLDEIGEMPLKLQAELLRVVQEREVRRVGGDRILPVDVRIVAATNHRFHALLKNEMFRKDLYYRLAVLKLHVPPLRERKEDILPLAEFFLSKHGPAHRKARRVEIRNLRPLEGYDWPGNVRELEHAIQQLLILSDGDAIDREMVEEMLRELRSERGPEDRAGGARADRLADIEADAIAAVLEEENRNKTRAARRLGIHRSTLRRKLQGGSI